MDLTLEVYDKINLCLLKNLRVGQGHMTAPE